MSVGRRLSVALTFLALASGTRLAKGESPPSAEELFRQGRAELAEERYEQARSYFQRSHALEPALGTLLNLAVCEERMGKLHDALRELEAALAMASPDDYRRPLVLERLAKLDARVPRLTIRTSRGSRPNVNIFLDAHRLEETKLGEVIRVDPGTHVLECTGAGDETCTTVIEMAEGRTSEVVLAIGTKTSPLPPLRGEIPPTSSAIDTNDEPGPLPTSSPERKSFAYATGAFGLASIVVGLIAGAAVLRQKAVISEHCHDKECDAEGVAAAQAGSTYSTIGTMTTAFGLVAVGASAYLLISTPSTHRASTSWTVTGSF